MAAKILKYLQKPASFSIPKSKSSSPPKLNFSAPFISIIPEEARKKKKKEEVFEPTSPKVSCIGQVNSKKKCKKNKNKKKERKLLPSKSMIGCMFRARVKPDRRSDEEVKTAAPIGKMTRYTSRRNTLAGFDWRLAAAEDDEDEVIIPHSAPILIGGGAVALEPKKEVNLWKRRTMARPPPLEVK